MKHTSTPTALVTGSARGIGRGCIKALAKHGFNLVINDLTMSDTLAEAVIEVEAIGVKAIALTGDISDVTDHERMVDEAWNAFGGIECLVNNAGVSVAQRDDLLRITPESFDRLIEINLRGTFFLTQELARRMAATPSDSFRSIITISSANSQAASPDRGEYCISKSGLTMMSKLFAIRLAEEGINVYEVRPGVISTDMTAVAQQRYDELFSKGLAPINRWGTPQDVGTSVATLATGALPYTTGEAIHVDGGLLIPRF